MVSLAWVVSFDRLHLPQVHVAGQADGAQRHVLRLTDGYFSAPQVFYFTPQRR
jgi:hypothetical protein